MDMLKQISDRIALLKSGENYTISAQELLVSRSDFQSISIFLKQEAKQGMYSIVSPSNPSMWLGATSLTINKY